MDVGWHAGIDVSVCSFMKEEEKGGRGVTGRAETRVHHSRLAH